MTSTSRWTGWSASSVSRNAANAVLVWRGTDPADPAPEWPSSRRPQHFGVLRLVTFMEYDLGYFDDETCRLEPINNPIGPKLLPMSPE